MIGEGDLPLEKGANMEQCRDILTVCKRGNDVGLRDEIPRANLQKLPQPALRPR